MISIANDCARLENTLCILKASSLKDDIKVEKAEQSRQLLLVNRCAELEELMARVDERIQQLRANEELAERVNIESVEFLHDLITQLQVNCHLKNVNILCK